MVGRLLTFPGTWRAVGGDYARSARSWEWFWLRRAKQQAELGEFAAVCAQARPVSGNSSAPPQWFIAEELSALQRPAAPAPGEKSRLARKGTSRRRVQYTD